MAGRLSIGNCLEDKIDERGVLEHDSTPTAGRLLIDLLLSYHYASCYMGRAYLRIEQKQRFRFCGDIAFLIEVFSDMGLPISSETGGA